MQSHQRLPMHKHFGPIPEGRMEPFVRFEDREDWTLRRRRDFPVYRLTSSKSEDRNISVRQTIRVITTLVRRNDVDQIEIDQPSRQWEQDVRSEGWSSDRSLPERKPLVTAHDQIQPRVISEFINHFWLTNDGDNLIDDVTGDPVLKKTVNDTGETVYIDGRYLFDFLRDHDLALLVGYFQGRQIKNPPHMSLADTECEGNERGGTFRFSCFCRDEDAKSQFWDGNYWWVGVLDPDDYDLGKKQEEEQIRATTTVADIDSSQFTVDEAERDENALKSVFFDEELLDRYRRQDGTTVEQWSAQGGYIQWKHYHGVRFYRNDHNELYITAKDLQKIPPSELGTWADYNIVPEGEMPEEASKNYFNAEWVESEAPHRAVVESFEEIRDRLNEIFDGDYIVEDMSLSLEDLQRPAIPAEDAFLDVVNEYHKGFIETISAGEVASLLRTQLDQEEWTEIEEEGGIQGSKQALYELICCFEEKRVADTILEPFNAIYDFRTYEGHRGAEDKKERALNELGFHGEPDDYREVYDELVRALMQRLAELEQLTETWT